MNEVEVNKADLLTQLLANRTEHVATYEAALTRYRERMTEWLDARLGEARGGRAIERVIPYPVPENYTDSYDAAIEALAWEVNDTVTLEMDDFNRLVRNKWEWEKRFYANTTSYTAGSFA